MRILKYGEKPWLAYIAGTKPPVRISDYGRVMFYRKEKK